MKTLAAVLALGLTLTAPVCTAADRSSVRKFKAELTEGLGKRTDLAATRIIARTLRESIRRDSRRSVAYARLGNRALRDRVETSLRGRAAVVIFRESGPQLIDSNGRLDKTFSRFVRLIIRKLPNRQKIDPVLNPIAERLVQISESKGGPPEQSQLIRDIVESAAPPAPCFCN